MFLPLSLLYIYLSKKTVLAIRHNFVGIISYEYVQLVWTAWNKLKRQEKLGFASKVAVPYIVSIQNMLNSV